MKKGKITMTITIGIISIVLVCTMLMQFKTVEETDITQIENMREAELRESLASWKEKFEETAQKLEVTNNTINEYKRIIETNEEATGLLEEELLEAKTILGATDVQGEGVIITLTDNEEKNIEAKDLLVLVNELRKAGAEAISINDERIINMTDIVDISSKYILINSQIIVSPYTVKAIGDQKYLQSALSIKSGYIDVYTRIGKDNNNRNK